VKHVVQPQMAITIRLHGVCAHSRVRLKSRKHLDVTTQHHLKQQEIGSYLAKLMTVCTQMVTDRAGTTDFATVTSCVPVGELIVLARACKVESTHKMRPTALYWSLRHTPVVVLLGLMIWIHARSGLYIFCVLQNAQTSFHFYKVAMKTALI